MKPLFMIPLIFLLCGFIQTKPQIEVQDGANFTLLNNGYHVRLFGMDVPKMGNLACQDAHGKAYDCALMSKNYLFSLINRKPLRCFIKTRSRKDTVSECFINGRMTNVTIEMLRAGWAVVDKNHPFQRFTAAEAEAKAHHNGIWQGKFIQPAE